MKKTAPVKGQAYLNDGVISYAPKGAFDVDIGEIEQCIKDTKERSKEFMKAYRERVRSAKMISMNLLPLVHTMPVSLIIRRDNTLHCMTMLYGQDSKMKNFQSPIKMRIEPLMKRTIVLKYRFPKPRTQYII